MAQITLRIEDQKADELRQLAAREDRSVNAILSSLVDMVLDPSTAATDDQELYERLVRAGLADASPSSASVGSRRPSRQELAVARASLIGGPLASDLISQERD